MPSLFVHVNVACSVNKVNKIRFFFIIHLRTSDGDQDWYPDQIDSRGHSRGDGGGLVSAGGDGGRGQSEGLAGRRGPGSLSLREA